MTSSAVNAFAVVTAWASRSTDAIVSNSKVISCSFNHVVSPVGHVFMPTISTLNYSDGPVKLLLNYSPKVSLNIVLCSGFCNVRKNLVW